MKSKYTYRNLNWEYEWVEEIQTIKRGRHYVGELHKHLNIYNPSGNKIITFEYPEFLKFDMSIIEAQIDDYIIIARKKKLEKLNEKKEY